MARPDDSDALLSIYAPYIVDTTVTFETEPPTPADFRQRVEGILERYPYLVHEENGDITGYAYAAREFERAAYRYNATVSVYLRPEAGGKGIGTGLYARLLELLRRQGLCNAYAIIALPNAASRRLHARMGFRDIGVHPRTGYKFGRWIDVLWMGLRLREDGDFPHTPTAFSDLPRSLVDAVLRDGKDGAAG